MPASSSRRHQASDANTKRRPQHAYFNSWQEAHAHLEIQAELSLQNAYEALQDAQSRSQRKGALGRPGATF